jgi:nucleoside-diphosphate-sugar epimerase
LKIIITGASGFIGGHLIRKLSGIEGTEIVPLTRRKIPNLIKVSNYTDAPEGDVLIHLAEDNNLKNVASRDLAYENDALNTLRTLLEKKYKRIIYASSSTLYGDKSVAPHSIRDEIFAKNPYTRIKSLSESAVLENPNGVVVRLANVYGSLMSTNNVMSQILRQIPQQGDLEVGDVTPVRDFVWVEDVAEGISMLTHMDSTETEKSKMYNLGSGVGTSIGDLALLTLKLAGQSERRVMSKKRTRVISSIVLDCSETTNACGWTPRVSLRQGIASLLTSSLKTER